MTWVFWGGGGSWKLAAEASLFWGSKSSSLVECYTLSSHYQTWMEHFEFKWKYFFFIIKLSLGV